jgi:hypothetical protein
VSEHNIANQQLIAFVNREINSGKKTVVIPTHLVQQASEVALADVQSLASGRCGA